MVQRNMSDIIEEYFKSILDKHSAIEIKRSDIAERFDCVPSQINYVINTRFTQEHGYMVESKRGGGGYIRIIKVQVIDEAETLQEMAKLVGEAITERSATIIIDTLVEENVLTEREALLMYAILNSDFLSQLASREDEARAIIMKQMLLQMRYTY